MEFHAKHPLEGYRRLTFMMLDANVVAASPSSVYRVLSMTSVDDARQAVTQSVHHYNTVRLHSAIGYVTPHTKLAGKEKELFAQRDEKLEAAREKRRLRRAEAIQNVA